MSTASVTAETTASALVATSPLVGSRSSGEMDTILAGILNRAEFGALSTVVGAAFAGGFDYLDDARIDEPLIAMALAFPKVEPESPASLTFNPPDSDAPEVRLGDLWPGGVPNVFKPTIIPSPKRNTDFFILDNKRTNRPNTVDWTMELFRLSPSQFPNGIGDVLDLQGTSLLTPDNNVPFQNGYHRATLVTANFDLLGLLANAVVDGVNGVVKGRTGVGLDVPKTDQFTIDRNTDDIYLIQSYSGNIPNGLDFQLAVLNAGDPNSQWEFAVAGNLLLAALDAAGVFTDAKGVTGIDSDFIATLNIDLAKILSTYRKQGDLSVTTFLELAKATTTSVIKSYYANLVSKETVSEIAPRLAKTIGKTFDIIGKVASAAQAVERLTGLGIESTWAVERSIMIVGNPLKPYISEITPRTGFAGETVTIIGGNFSWDAEELSVSFCDFSDTSGNVAASIPAVITRASPTHIDVTVPNATAYRDAFTNGTSFLCVTKGDDEAFSTAIGDEGEFTMPMPPAITSVEPGVLQSSSMVAIRGERLGPDTRIFFDGSTEMTTFQKSEGLVVALLPSAAPGEHTLTARVGDENSAPFPITIVFDTHTPGNYTGGLNITITDLSMTNQPDGKVSVLEAFLIANGGLGRPIEIHVDGEPSGTVRETDFISGDQLGLGGGAGVRDTIRWTTGGGTLVSDIPLPAISSGDRFLLNGLTIDGSGAPAGADGFVFDDSDDVQLQNVIIRGFPGEGIRVTNETEGLDITGVTVDGVGGDGLFIDNLCAFNRFTTVELLNIGGKGLSLSGESRENQFSDFQINTTGADGVIITGGSDQNRFTDFSVTKCSGDGLEISGDSERNRFSEAFEVSEVDDVGIRITGSGTRFNFFADVPFTGGQAFETVIAVRDCGAEGIRIDGGANFNTLSTRFVSNSTGAGVRITGAGTDGNVFGHPYRTRPSTQFGEDLFFTLVADHDGHGVVLENSASQTLITGVNLYNNNGDALRLDGSSFNHLLSNYSGVQDFIEELDPVAAPSSGASVRLTNGSSNNVIGTIVDVTVFTFGSSGFEVFLNHFSNDLGGGIIIEEDSDNNHVYGTRIGFQGFREYHGPVNGAAIALRSGASGNILGGGSDFDEQLLIGSCTGAAILMDGPDTSGNRLAGAEIGRFPTGVAAVNLPGLGIHLRNGAKSNQIGIYGPMDKGNFGVRRNSVVVNGAQGPGLWLEACGGSVGTDLSIRDPNRVHNCSFQNCETGILLSDNAGVNEVGGTRRGGPQGGGFVPFDETYTGEGNSVSGSTLAGLRYSSMTQLSPLLRNTVRNLAISGAFNPVESLDLTAGPPDGCGILIDSDCENVIVGEDVNLGISVTNTVVGAYIDGADNNRLRSLDITAFGNMGAGIAIRGGSNNVIGEAGSGRNLISFVESSDFETYGVALVDGANENTVQSCSISFGSGTGIFVSDSALNLIGGSGGIFGNEVLGHGQNGIKIEGEMAVGNRVQNNFIGIARSGALSDPDLGSYVNAADGVVILGAASGNTIGGSHRVNQAGASVTATGTSVPVPGQNIITQSGNAGVAVSGSNTSDNHILSNSIFANSGFGIDLRSGGNNGLSAPAGTHDLTSANGTVDPSIPIGSKVQIFSDTANEGEILIGETAVGGGGTWVASALKPAPFATMTATVTHPDGSTSPFGLLSAPVSSFGITRSIPVAPASVSSSLTEETAVHRLKLDARGASIRIRGLTLTASGSLDDAASISEVRLFLDTNRNGSIEESDLLLQGGTTFDSDNGMVVFEDLDEIIENSEPEEWLVSYIPGGPAPAEGSTFSLSLAEIAAVDAVTFLPAGLDITPSNPFPVLSDNFTVGEPPTNGFDAFMAGFLPGETRPEIIGRLRDPDKDGLVNLLEWILGGNPELPDRDQIGPKLIHGASGELVLEFRRRENLPPGTRTEVKVSETLSGFELNPTVTGTPSAVSNGDGTETVHVTITRPSGQTELFLILEASE